MLRYKLTTTFDGTNFSGWQTQPKKPTIQAELEKAFAMILGKKVNVVGCGRTDAGVHAKKHVSHLTLDDSIDEEHTVHKLSGILPPQIRILSLEKVDLDFHARFHAKKKTYHYYIHNKRYLSPFSRHYCYHVRAALDISLMRQGAHLLVGTHDFRSFAHQASHGCAKFAPVKTIYHCDIIPENDALRFEVTGSGFLHKMVRNIVGTLVDLGRGKITLEEFRQIFESKDRRKAGKTAPPQGLFLVEVDYDTSE